MPTRRRSSSSAGPAAAGPPPSPAAVLDIEKDFNMLSLRDLVAARDLYHLHLMDKQHVVATAVGRYLIRKSEPWPQSKGAAAAHDTRVARQMKKEPRTLANSEVRPYSWPCVLVFVDQWADLGSVGDDFDAAEVVPRTLAMPDGTRTPVCVVLAEPVASPAFAPISPRFPEAFIGGGYPIVAQVQDEEHVASIGCLVTDGHDVYALTNRHVAGRPGEPLYSAIGGERVRLGVSSEKQLTRKLFGDVYPEWPGRNVYLNLDAGLVRIDDLTRWTAQVYGIGMMGKLADLNVDNISLRLIECPVRAFGAASGPLAGQIAALFYRYKSVGGSEYAADFLIGPRDSSSPLTTRPGDSGTVWMLDLPPSDGGPRPIAVQWGGHAFVGADGTTVAPYALATCLSTVCRLLDVDVVRDWNVGMLDYWGAVGHYTIATAAVGRINGKKYPRLKALMAANLERISFAAGTITKARTSGLSTHQFVPLADVPDLAWKMGPHNRGNAEHPNHFADMDAPRAGGTLLDLCEKNIEANAKVDVWRKYYTDVKDSSRGLLPFRVQQFYEEMVKDLKKPTPDFKRFVCAAGIASHYVGDACQPLHVSSWFNGDPTTMLPNPNAGGWNQPAKIPRGYGVHSAYEDDMVNFNIADIAAFVQADARALPRVFRGGAGAARAVVRLILHTFATIKPKDLVAAYIKIQQQQPTPSAAAAALWTQFGAQTQEVIAAGARSLAVVWESAWAEGGGEARSPSTPTTFSESDLTAIYADPSFVPSKTLDHICEEIGC